MGKKIEVLGSGCAKCKSLKKSAEESVKILGWEDVDVFYITDMNEIIKRGITSTPVLTLDGKIIISGHYLPSDKLADVLKESIE
ncbi:MAG: MTH895/ArsE family thioredoxin-like protein [Candidatus Hodarchaeales archaeon]